MGRLSLRDGARPEGFHLALLLTEAAQQLRQEELGRGSVRAVRR